MSQYLNLHSNFTQCISKYVTNLSVETDQCLVLLWATQFRRLINLERSCCVGDGNIGSVINAYQVFFDGHIKAHSYCDVSRFPFHAIRPLDRTLKNILIERLPFESHLVTTSVLSSIVQFLSSLSPAETIFSKNKTQTAVTNMIRKQRMLQRITNTIQYNTIIYSRDKK